MFYGILIALQMVISVLLVISILLQSSKGGGLAGIAGGMMSSAVFGGRGAASFLGKATAVLAALFMINCVGMAVITSAKTTATSVTQQAASKNPANSPVPAIPGGNGGDQGNDQALPADQTPAPNGGK
jgi:preprotein translocase subunit SecG